MNHFFFLLITSRPFHCRPYLPEAEGGRAVEAVYCNQISGIYLMFDDETFCPVMNDTVGIVLEYGTWGSTGGVR